MGTGVQVTNDSNVVQIDADYKNLCFVGHYSASTTQVTGQNYARATLTISSGTANRVVAVRSSVGAISSLSGDTLTLLSTSAATVDAYIFDVSPAVQSGSGCGLLVYDGSGSLVYDSNKKYMKVAGVSKVPDGLSNFAYNSLPTGTYAAALTSTRRRIVEVQQANIGWRIYMDFLITNENGAEVDLVNYFVIPQSSGSITGSDITAGGVLMIFDVFGYS